MPCKYRLATAAPYIIYDYTLHYTTEQDLASPLFLSNAYFLSDDPYHVAQEGCDGHMDKNRYTIAVTLCLRFVARVNDYYFNFCAIFLVKVVILYVKIHYDRT